jgi:hypothetical protein
MRTLVKAKTFESVENDGKNAPHGSGALIGSSA